MRPSLATFPIRIAAQRLHLSVLLAVAVTGPQVSAQTWDNTGNALLNGTYCFREVIWQVGDNSGNLSREIAISGNMNFDGNGNYTLTNVRTVDSTSASGPSTITNGTFSMAASGYGSLTSPLVTGDPIYGLTAQGILIGSSTENRTGYNDLFIAARLATAPPPFQGSYTLAGIDFPTGSIFDVRDSLLQFSADGNGNIPTATASGYIAGKGLGGVSQYLSKLQYSMANGVATVNFGGVLTASTLVAGAKNLCFSPDGNFVFGGSPTGWDMIAGVRSSTAGFPKFNGLYYQAGVDENNTQLQAATAQHTASGSATLDSYYGSFDALTGGQILGHQRVLPASTRKAIHSTYAAWYSLNSNGEDDSNDQEHYFFGAGGAIRIGLGNNPLLGISVALHAPALSKPGVFLDPTRISNAASSAPFTSGVAPGELITVYGTNLATGTQYDPTFPSTLAGVQVTVNNRPAPLIFVSPTQVSALVPFATTEAIASIQVINGGTPSNAVTSYVTRTSPGVYTVPSGGLGYAAALHADYSLVTPESPAQPDEILAVFVTGLGAVMPSVPDGTPGPPSSSASNAIAAWIGGQPASVLFDGLAPQLSGIYQINVKVPHDLSDGTYYLSIAGPDFDTSEALLPVTSANP